MECLILIPTLPVKRSDQVSQSSRLWNIIGQKMPRNEIVYFTQIILIYVIIGISLYELTNNQSNTERFGYLSSAQI